MGWSTVDVDINEEQDSESSSNKGGLTGRYIDGYNQEQKQ